MEFTYTGMNKNTQTIQTRANANNKRLQLNVIYGADRVIHITHECEAPAWNILVTWTYLCASCVVRLPSFLFKYQMQKWSEGARSRLPCSAGISTTVDWNICELQRILCVCSSRCGARKTWVHWSSTATCNNNVVPSLNILSKRGWCCLLLRGLCFCLQGFRVAACGTRQAPVFIIISSSRRRISLSATNEDARLYIHTHTRAHNLFLLLTVFAPPNI